MSYSNQSNELSSYSVIESHQIPAGAISKKFMASVFLWMFIALGISAVVALFIASDTSNLSYFYEVSGNQIHRTGLGTLVSFAPLAFILTLSFGFNRLSSTVIAVILSLFAASMGASISLWLVVYSAASVISCFLSAAAMFGVMAVMGYTTDKDLTKMGSILMMALVGIVIASMINFFMHSEGMSYIISFISVIIFTGLTAYDVQKLKVIGAGLAYEGIQNNETKKLALLGALNLYLDFVNIFLSLLRIFGKRD